jgi:outer membrane receptor protein involved in Fe transport
MPLRIILLLISILPFAFLSAQDGIVKGKITDSNTKEPLGGVSVYLDKRGITTSQADGTYELKIPSGNHYAEFDFIGYKKPSVALTIKPGETVILNISLEAEAAQLGVMVISAGKFEQKLEEVTVSMDVIKSTLIQNKNTSSADKILDQCPGVDILDGQANIRGGSGFSYGAGSRVMVLVDDLPVLTGDAADVKWNFIPVENIEQVEIIKGASSALFGSSALNGVINFRTSYPKDSSQTTVHISQGLYDNPKRRELAWWKNHNPLFGTVSLLHTSQFKNFDLVLGGNYFFNDGYRKLEKEQRNRFNFGTRYRFQKAKGLSAGMNGNFMDSHGGNFILWQNADSAYFPQGGTVSNYHTFRATLDPFIIYFTPSGDRHSLKTRFYRASNANNTDQESVSDVWYGEYQYQLHLRKDFILTSGLTGTYSEVHSASLYGNHFSNHVGVFSQADKKFSRLILSLGVRGEYVKVDNTETKYKVVFGKDTAVLPIQPVLRAGMNYRLFSQTHLRASFGQGYRFPSVAEKFIQTKVSGLTIYPNPDILPETGWSAEIGIKQGFKINGLKGYLDVAGFQQEYKNMLEFTFDYWVPAGIPYPINPFTQLQYFGAKSINVGRAKITGAEISAVLEGKIRKTTLALLAGYTYIYPIDLDYDPAKSGGTFQGNLLKYRYEHTAKMDLQADYKKWSTGLSIRYNSFMKNIDASFQKELFNDLFPNLHNLYILPGLKEYRANHNKGDIVCDYRFSFELTKKFKVWLVVTNLLNREYMGRPGDVQPPRSFSLSLNAKL